MPKADSDPQPAPSARDLLREAARRLQAAGCDAPRLDAELLLGRAWGKNRAALFAAMPETPPEPVRRMFAGLLARRLRREPMAQILGEREFWSRPFRVTPDVLAPRPETEHLIEAALALFSDRAQPLEILDLCTGSGCIAVTLACELPHARVTATDISPAALAIARENAAQHNARNIRFHEGDLWDALPDASRFDLILANPPYVSKAEMDELAPELAFEPRIALTDEADGLSVSRRILAGAPARLNPGGALIIETGPCGLPETPADLQLDGPEPIHDLAGLLRGGVWRAR